MMDTVLFSEVDSKRFSQNVHRGSVSSIDPVVIRNYINTHAVDLLILRVPVTLSEDIHKLNKLEYEVILADTLVYYNTSLAGSQPKTLKNELTFIEVNDQNVSIIQELIPAIFIDYKNHYTSNPHLDREKITKGYIEWASGFVRNTDLSKISWIVYKEQTPIGFATCSVDETTSQCEGVLYGVLPNYSGGGVYSDIIRFTQAYFLNKGIAIMKVSTQIQNFAVQKVWAREGFLLNEAFYTFHIIKNDTI